MSRRLAAIGLVAVLALRSGNPARADHGLVWGAHARGAWLPVPSRGDYVHTSRRRRHGVRAGGVLSARHHEGEGGRTLSRTSSEIFLRLKRRTAIHLPIRLLHRQVRGHQPAIRRLPGRTHTRRAPFSAPRRATRQGLHPDVLARQPPQWPRSTGHRGGLVRRLRLLSLGRQADCPPRRSGKKRRAARTGWRIRGAIRLAG